MPDERTNPLQEEGTQCVVVLQVLRSDHPQPWTRVELQAELDDLDPEALAVALERLREHGVVILDGEHVQASRCARRLDYLELISI